MLRVLLELKWCFSVLFVERIALQFISNYPETMKLIDKEAMSKPDFYTVQQRSRSVRSPKTCFVRVFFVDCQRGHIFRII